jgi:hypothetical protein
MMEVHICFFRIKQILNYLLIKQYVLLAKLSLIKCRCTQVEIDIQIEKEKGDAINEILAIQLPDRSSPLSYLVIKLVIKFCYTLFLLFFA